MITLNFKPGIAFLLGLMLFAPMLRAEDAAAEQAQVEAQDAKVAPKEEAAPAPATADADDTAPAAASKTDAPSATPAPGTTSVSSDDDIATKTKRAIERATFRKDPKDPPPKPVLSSSALKPHPAALGSLTMRQPKLRLDQISLWRTDDKSVSPDVWDGTVAEDVQLILPALVMAKSQHIKDITLRIAMSGVYIPAGMTDMDYIHWRADVLVAQKQPALAARLMSTARLGRDSHDDLMRRTAYELLAGEIEAACVEGMAAGDNTKPFWQGLAALCAQHSGDKGALKTAADAMPDGAIKAAAADGNAADLTDAIVKSSGFVPATIAIPDNQEILDKLTQLLSDIDGDDDPKIAAAKNKGQLLLLSLGALRADKHGDDTQKLTDKALGLAGF